MNKLWSKRFFAFTIGLIFLLVSFMLSFAVFFSKIESPVAANSDEFVELEGRTTASATLFGIMPFNFSGSSSEVIKTADGNKEYLSYKMKDGYSIAYEHDLALTWKERLDENNKDTAVTKYFSFTFKVVNPNFSTITLTLEAPSVNATKAGKVSASVEIDKNRNVKWNGAVKGTLSKIDDTTPNITLELAEDNTSNTAYKVQIKEDSGTPIELGSIENVNGYYSSYRSLNNVTITPLKMEYKSDASQKETEKEPLLLVKSLNEQEFRFNDRNIVDNAPPVVVPTKQIDYFINATSFYSNFEYRAIDVLNFSLPATEYLGVGTKISEIIDDNNKDKNKVENRTKQITLKPENGQDNKATAVVRLTETKTESSGTTETDYDTDLGWYLENGSTNAGIPIIDTSTFEESALAPDMDWKGSNTDNTTNINNFLQASLDATGYNDHKDPTSTTKAEISMPLGNGAYFYFGDLSGIVKGPKNDISGHKITLSRQDIQYSIYYKVNNGSVQSGGSYTNDQLRLQLNNLEGAGLFAFEVILVPQYSKNNSKIPMQIGNQPVTADNVFQLAKKDANKDKLPILEFNIKYTGPEVNDSKSVQVGYVNSTYYGVNIEVIGLDNGATWLKKEYSLYELVTESKEGITRDSILEAMKQLRASNPSNRNAQIKIAENKEKYDKAPTDYIGYLREIQEEDKGDSAYKWNPDSGSYNFIPQTESFYIVQAKVTSNYGPMQDFYGFQAIDVLSSLDINAGHDSSWVQKNLASIILFSISGALLIVLVVLIFLPNKNKKNTKLIGAKETNNNTIQKEIYDKYQEFINKK